MQDRGAERSEQRTGGLPDDEGGDSACWADLVCWSCGHLDDADPTRACPSCGARRDDG